jgi:peptidoglycan/xylan/chitin deacetylase (PgdA/CDA1 family)
MKLKHHIRNTLASALHAVGVTRSERLRELLTVVTFHRVLTEAEVSQYPLPGLSVTPELLNDFVEYFQSRFQCVTITDGVRLLGSGTASKRPLLAITFDDGRKDNFQHARPILNQHSVPATFYVPAAFVENQELLWHDLVAYAVSSLVQSGRTDVVASLLRTNMKFANALSAAHWAANHLKSFNDNDRRQIEFRLQHEATTLAIPVWEGSMNWKELGLLIQDGHEIGSHTMTHAVLGQNQTDHLQEEISGSKQLLESHLGTTVRTFSFPTGAFCDESINCVHAAGYESAVTTDSGCNNRQTSLLQLKRINLQGDQNQSLNGRLNPAVLAWRMASVSGAR